MENRAMSEATIGPPYSALFLGVRDTLRPNRAPRHQRGLAPMSPAMALAAPSRASPESTQKVL